MHAWQQKLFDDFFTKIFVCLNNNKIIILIKIITVISKTSHL